MHRRRLLGLNLRLCFRHSLGLKLAVVFVLVVSEAGALDDGNIGVCEQLEKAERIEVASRGRDHALQRFRELPGLPFLSALQNANRGLRVEVRRGKPGRRDGAAVAGTDHDKIVFTLALFPRCGEHETSKIV